jgi:hypothetical protein
MGAALAFVVGAMQTFAVGGMLVFAVGAMQTFKAASIMSVVWALEAGEATHSQRWQFAAPACDLTQSPDAKRRERLAGLGLLFQTVGQADRQRLRQTE